MYMYIDRYVCVCVWKIKLQLFEYALKVLGITLKYI